MYKIGFVVLGAALLAAMIVALPGASPTVEAGVAAPKGDRLDITLRMANCLHRGWPYDQACSNGPTRSVRLVTTDRF